MTFGTTGEGPACTVAGRKGLLEAMLGRHGNRSTGQPIRPDQIIVANTAPVPHVDAFRKSVQAAPWYYEKLVKVLCSQRLY